MLADLRTYIGLQYTATAALLVAVFVIVPGLIVYSISSDTCAACVLVACSGVCLALAWLKWRWHAEQSVPSIVVPTARPK